VEQVTLLDKTFAPTLYASAAALGPLTIGGGDGAPAYCHRRRRRGFWFDDGVYHNAQYFHICLYFSVMNKSWIVMPIISSMLDDMIGIIVKFQMLKEVDIKPLRWVDENHKRITKAKLGH
jgi:hypothetical protein